MSFTLPSLPYDYTSLEPYIDSTTMNIHHTKHHQTYVNNVNNAVKADSSLQGLDILTLNQKVGAGIDSKAIQNSGGGHWNHSFFWTVLGKSTDNNGPSSKIKEALDKDFGSYDDFQKQFSTAAVGVFGSGWAWLGVDSSGKLKVTSTPNQNNPLQALEKDNTIPVLGLDVWEHAYYLKYQNRRPEYVSAFWNVVNWEVVNKYYDDAVSSKKIFTL